jgi:N-formylmaleamate deformylase
MIWVRGQRRLLLFLVPLSLAGCGPASSNPAPAPPPLATAARPLSLVKHGSLQIEVIGDGPSIVLLPGLGCAARVFDPIVPHLARRFRLHLVNLPGFAGTTVTGGPPLGTARTDVVGYMESLGEGSVVVIGHSVGAFVGFWVASQRPELVRRLVAIDGVPYLPALFFPLATPAAMAPMASQTREYFAAMTPAQLRQALEGTLTPMIPDRGKRETVLRQAALSSAAALGAAQYEVSTVDLREAVGKITAPVLLLVGTRDIPPSIDREGLVSAYRMQVSRIPRHQIEWLPKAGHFAFVDQPDEVLTRIGGFLGAQEVQ